MNKPAWTQNEAIEFCRKIEYLCPQFGCHVALTGGLLYKNGPRKDLDIVFYRIRQSPEIEIDRLFNALEKIGIQRLTHTSAWCIKAQFDGRNIDCFFPEAKLGDYI